MNGTCESESEKNSSAESSGLDLEQWTRFGLQKKCNFLGRRPFDLDLSKFIVSNSGRASRCWKLSSIPITNCFFFLNFHALLQVICKETNGRGEGGEGGGGACTRRLHGTLAENSRKKRYVRCSVGFKNNYRWNQNVIKTRNGEARG